MSWTFNGVLWIILKSMISSLSTAESFGCAAQELITWHTGLYQISWLFEHHTNLALLCVGYNINYSKTCGTYIHTFITYNPNATILLGKDLNFWKIVSWWAVLPHSVKICRGKWWTKELTQKILQGRGRHHKHPFLHKQLQTRHTTTTSLMQRGEKKVLAPNTEVLHSQAWVSVTSH